MFRKMWVNVVTFEVLEISAESKEIVEETFLEKTEGDPNWVED